MNEEERKYQFFILMLKAADLVFEYANTDAGRSVDSLWLNDFRGDGEANPHYNQTETGLFLEFYYGLPNRFWTPWGLYHFGGSGSGSWHEKTPLILQRFGATLLHEEELIEGARIGPLYAVHQIDDIKLPEPVLRVSDDYISYEQAKKEWREMMARYLREKSKTSIPPLESGKAMPNLQKSPNWDLRKDVKIFSNEGYPFCEGWPSSFGRIDKIFELILWTGVRHFAFVDPSFQYQADGLTWRSVRTRERIERYNVIAWQEVDPDDVRLK